MWTLNTEGVQKPVSATTHRGTRTQIFTRIPVKTDDILVTSTLGQTQNTKGFVMIKRPILINIVAWVLIVWSVLSLLTNFVSFSKLMIFGMAPWDFLPWSSSPMLAFQQIAAWLNQVVLLVVGILLLKQRNWSRYFYVTWGLVYLLVNYAAMPIVYLWFSSAVLLLLFTVILFLPKSNIYFRQKASV